MMQAMPSGMMHRVTMGLDAENKNWCRDSFGIQGKNADVLILAGALRASLPAEGSSVLRALFFKIERANVSFFFKRCETCYAGYSQEIRLFHWRLVLEVFWRCMHK
jgi:hypothetical protein